MTSTIDKIEPQIDGRAYVTERHVLDAGTEQFVTYLAEVDADIEAILALHAQEFIAPQGGW